MRIIPSFVRRRPKTWIAVIIVLLLAGFGISAARKPKQPEYVTAEVKRGDVIQTVEAVGTIVSDRDLELRFAGAGLVDQVFVKEGDTVRAGQRLASLRAGSLGASINAQAAVLQAELANLRALEEGTRPEDIAIAEADVNGKRASLQVAQSTLKSAEENLAQAQEQITTLEQEARVNLSGQVSTATSSAVEQIVTADNALSTIDDILNRVDVQDAMVKDRPEAANEIRAAERNARSLLQSARVAASAASDYAAALAALDKSRVAINTSSSVMDALFGVIGGLRETSSFTSTIRESVKADIAAQRSTIQNAGNTLTTVQSSLQNASASYDTKISSQRGTVASLQGTRDKARADIATFTAAIASAEAQLALKRAGARKTDIDAARARIRQAQANLARARADFADTLLVAPVSGTVTHVHIKGGEYPPAGAAVQLLGESPFRVEMFVSEIDIPKVQLTQSGSIQLDAFRDTQFQLRVGQADRSATEVDGVPKYRVMLDFVYPHTELSIGMTGDAEVVTGRRPNVLSVPLRAVLEGENRTKIVRILQKDGTVAEKSVTLGIEGGSGDVEIVEGVQEGDTVVVLVKE